MRCRAAILCSVTALAVLADGARAQPYLPPGHHLFAGLTGGTSVRPFQRLVGKHPPVFELYVTWNSSTSWLAARDPSFRSRLGLELSTSRGYGQPGVITPAQIAAGRSDGFLIGLARNLARSGRIVYVRLMGEMNGYWNAYSAFNADGSSRGPRNSPRAFIAAWRRSVLILRGGSVRSIDRSLHALHLPPVKAALGGQASLPQPHVAFLWVPQDAGSPDLPANGPASYWPGSRYVDWVGTDFYASAPNFSQLSAYYDRSGRKPFVISEWAVYGSDDPAFVRQLFAWARAHPRVRMLNYYQGFTSSSPANPAHYPRSVRVLRGELRSPRFLAYPPEYAHPQGRPAPPPRPPQPGPPPGPGPCLPLAGVCLPGT